MIDKKMKKFDICIIGAGPGGYKAALILAKNGKGVCLIEKNEYKIGGTCLNEGCIPAKNFLESALYIKKMTYFNTCGVDGKINNFNIITLKNKTESIINSLRNGLKQKLQKTGITLIYGKVDFICENKIEIDETKEVITADKFIIAIGSIHKEHPVLKIDKNFILSSREVFKLEEIPKKILIVGAGAMGCEFANFFNATNSKVHIAEFTPSILPLEDSDVSSTIQREFKKQGIKVDTAVNAISYNIKNDKISVDFETKEGLQTFKYDKVLISIGRSPNTKELNFNIAKVKLDEKGFVKTDASLKTTNPNIFAIGDIVATPALAHQAYYEAKKVAFEILGFEKLSESVTPNVTFTTPQVGSVGKNERILKNMDKEFIIKKLFMKSLGMPKIKGEDSGFVKLLLDKEEKNILGASIVGYDATEIINQIAICINANLSVKAINSMIFPHPTMSESFFHLIEDILLN